MKILLTSINCSYKHKAMGIRWLYVANFNHEVKLKEFNLKQEYQTMLDYYLNCACEVIVFSCYIYNVDIIRQLITDLKKNQKNLRILIGGPEVSFNDDYLELGVEAILVGEGERQLYQYLDTGMADGVKTKHYQSKVKRAVSDISFLETLPSPYFLTFDLPLISKQYFYLETARGCPFSCSYCFSANDKKIRFFTKEYLEKIFNKLQHYNIDQVKILDRTFNCNNEHSLMVLELIEQNRSVNSFQMEIVVDSLSNEILNFLLNKASVEKYRFEVGIQSFNTQTLKAINRNCNLTKVTANTTALVDYGYVIHGDLIAGLPYEDLLSFKQSFNKIFQLGLAEIQVGILKLLPETPIKNQLTEFSIEYLEESPHTIISNKWFSNNDVKVIELVYRGVEKNYNNKRLVFSLKPLLKLNNFEPFELFYQLGNVLAALRAPYTMHEYFQAIYQAFENEDIKYYLALDYYLLFNHKVTKLFNFAISKDEKNKLRTYCLNNNILNVEQFDKYTTIICNEDVFSIILYRVNERKPFLINVNRELL
ncbi:MAG: B12-binding domain-containing radical SAM protein [Erysipelotrichaceae bacterium]